MLSKVADVPVTPDDGKGTISGEYQPYLSSTVIQAAAAIMLCVYKLIYSTIDVHNSVVQNDVHTQKCLRC